MTSGEPAGEELRFPLFRLCPPLSIPHSLFLPPFRPPTSSPYPHISVNSSPKSTAEVILPSAAVYTSQVTELGEPDHSILSAVEQGIFGAGHVGRLVVLVQLYGDCVVVIS